MERRIAKGISTCKKLVNKVYEYFTDWRNACIYSYDNVIVDSPKSFLSTDIFSTIISTKLSEREDRVVLILDVMKDHIKDSPQNFLSKMVEVFERFGARVVRFGLEESNYDILNGYDRIGIPRVWMEENSDYVSKVIEEISPLRRVVEQKELLNALRSPSKLSNFILEKFGPPSTTEEVRKSIKSSDKVKVASEAVSFLTALINPSIIVYKGIKYAAKLIDRLRKRSDETIKEYFEKWKNDLKVAFSPEILNDLIFSSESLKRVELEDLIKERLLVILNEFTEDYYIMFSSILPKMIYDTFFEEGEGCLFIEGADKILKINPVANAILNREGGKTALLISTKDFTLDSEGKASLYILSRDFYLIFDLSNEVFETLFNTLSIGERMMLRSMIEANIKDFLKGEAGLIIHHEKMVPDWKRVSTYKVGLLDKLRGFLGI
ncbi:MAG: hypothetical protein ACTSR0_06795 [Candidatus Asgardarchaeia archaeon]